MLWARPGALEEIAKAGLLVLDIDGVLLDPRPSFYLAAKQTASWAAERILGKASSGAISDGDIQAFKSIGGWNDDFDLACACAWTLIIREITDPSLSLASSVAGGLKSLDRYLTEQVPVTILKRARELCPTPRIRERAAATYAGLDRCHAMYGIDPSTQDGLSRGGLWHLESVLCDSSRLRRVPVPLAFFTGRNAAETALAAERLNLTLTPEMLAVDDGVTPRKPAPDGLLRVTAGRRGVFAFVGDSIDDQGAALAFRDRRTDLACLFVRVVGPQATPEAVEQSRAAGADVVVSTLDALLVAAWKEVVP